APPLAEQVTPQPSPPAPSPVAPQKAAPPPPESTAEEAVTYTIQDITWQKLSGRSVIRVRTSTPSPRYEVVLREDPLRLVLDVRDAILPRAQHRIIDVDLEKGSAVQSIIPFQYREEPSPITRIVVRLVTRTPYRVLREEETIRLEIADPPSLPAPLHPAEKEKEEQEEAPAEQPQKRYTGTRISLDFQRADINDILRLIAEVSGLNIITGGDVKGEVSIRMVNVPWDQALDVILKTYGLGQERIGNVIRVAPRERLVREQQEVLRIKQAEKLAEELVTKVIPIKYADAGELQENLKPLLSERGIINVDRRTNTLIVKDVEANLQQVLSLVETLDQQTPQVLIEARIVETSRSFERQFGIQWGGLLSSRTDFRFPRTIGITGGRGSVSTGIANPPPGPPAAEAPTTEDERGTFVVNLPAAVGPGSGAALGITLGHINNSALLDIQLSALENTGQGRVISSPRIVTLDNKEAKIDSGFTIPFATTSAEGTRTEFVDANINLTVTPHVTPDDFVIMQIRAARNEPDFARTAAGVAPTIVRREATTNVLVKDGETTVIGGLFRRNLTNDVNGVPYLSKIPILGWLFKNERRQDNNDELLIFITPRILRKRGGEQGPL
ncbi:MAG: type IV pilus secretin PilQ, partial [Nitrospinota bacterium]